MCFTDHLGTFYILTAHIEQPDAWLGFTLDFSSISIAQHSKLCEVRRLAFHVCSGIEQKKFIGQRGDDRSKGGSIDAFNGS